jgi:hypothetical protein
MMRPSRGRMVLAAVFGLLSLSAWFQVGSDLFGSGDEPPMLTGLQAMTAASAALATWGSWAGARWAPAAALLYGVIAGGMVAGLGHMVDVPANERGGLWTGTVFILAFGIWSAWWLRRSIRRQSAREMTAQ